MDKYVTVRLVMVCSMILNLCFIISNINQNVSKKELSWSRKAAEEAEAVAAISCSGHGRAYLDGLLLQDGHHQACECNACYAGSDCSLFLPHACDAEADSGDPYFLEPFWMQYASSSAVVVAGWHRMSYVYANGSFTSTLLENRIRKLHSVVGNAVTDGRYIVFGVGSTQLVNAIVHALSPHNTSTPAKVVASIPYFTLYQTQTDYMDSVNYKFEGDASLWKNSSDKNASTIIEFVTSPNNPDGQLNKVVLNVSYGKAVYDHAYYWPHYTGIPLPADEDIMIFTASKLTGHAGSRFGWAVIKDRDVYERVYSYVSINTMGVSRDTQMRVLEVLDAILQNEGREIFKFGYKTMKKRWERLRKVMSPSKHFSLQQIPPENCTYFRRLRQPTPAYAWLRCEREEDSNCYQVLKAAGIKGREGTLFGAQGRFVRLSVIRSQDDFEMLLQRLNKLVSSDHEDDAKTM